MRLRKGLFIIALAAAFVHGDANGFSLSGQNELRYGRRARTHLGQTGDLGIFENYLEMDASYQRLRLHLRQRYLLPSEYGQWQDGLDAFDKIYVEYATDNVQIRGGDFYRNWARGLLMGAEELIDLNFDSGLEGVLVEGHKDDFEMSAFRGVEIDTLGAMQESAEGAMVSYRFPLGFKLGLGMIHFNQTPRHEPFDRRGIEGEYSFDVGTIYAAYTAESFDHLNKKFYHSYYNSVEFYGSSWAVLIDYKNYRFAPYILPALQFPPPVYPQTLMYLFYRNPPTPHYENEVGYQVDFTYNLGDWNLNLNANQSSYQRTLTGQEGLSILPSLKDDLQPFWSAFLHAEYAPFGGDRLMIQGGYLEQTALWHRYGGGVLYEWLITPHWSLTGDFQSVWATELHTVWDAANGSYRDRLYREDYLNIALAQAGGVTLTGSIGRSGDEWAADGTKVRGESMRDIFGEAYFWPAVLVTAQVFERNQVRLFYGYERGGLSCSGGLCRWISPFKGIKATIISQF